MTFEELGLTPKTIKALKEDGIVEPTKIQVLTIPIVKAGKDLIAISHTGSGKTAAFGAPILEKIRPKAGLQALIITPTRELAVQIEKELKKILLLKCIKKCYCLMKNLQKLLAILEIDWVKMEL